MVFSRGRFGLPIDAYLRSPSLISPLYMLDATPLDTLISPKCSFPVTVGRAREVAPKGRARTSLAAGCCPSRSINRAADSFPSTCHLTFLTTWLFRRISEHRKIRQDAFNCSCWTALQPGRSRARCSMGTDYHSCLLVFRRQALPGVDHVAFHRVESQKS